MKKVYDGALPSGNSVAALDLLRLARMTGDEGFEERVASLMQSFNGEVSRSPGNFTQFLVAADFALGPTRKIVIAGIPGEKDTEAMLRAVRSRFLPRKVLLFHPEGDAGRGIEKLAPFVASQKAVDGKATAYVCRDFNCELPLTDAAATLSLLEGD